MSDLRTKPNTCKSLAGLTREIKVDCPLLPRWSRNDCFDNHSGAALPRDQAFLEFLPIRMSGFQGSGQSKG